MGQRDRWGSVYLIFGVLCPLLQGEGQKLPSNTTVSKAFIQSTSVIHVPQQGTLKCPINPVTARQCCDVTDRMMAFAYFCVRQMLEPLQISGDHVPLTIWWCYKIKQMIILQKCSKLGMNFNIVFYTCGQCVAPMRCFCQILLLVLTEGKEWRSIYFGYRKRILGIPSFYFSCAFSRHEWVNIINWKASTKASSHSNSLHSCFVLALCYTC